MHCSSRIAPLLVILIVYTSIVQAVYLSWVTRCCAKGQRKAKKGNNPSSCNSDDLNRRRFRAEIDRIICRHAERICCVKEIQKMSCESGKYEASQGQPCDSFKPFVGGDDFRECCDCCALGIKAKENEDVACSIPVFQGFASKNSSFPCLKAFKDCCSGSVARPPITLPSRNPKCSDNFCQQECRDIPNQGAKCFCRKGYYLLADRVSCRDMDECQLSNGSVCDPVQACVNSPGSYRCVNQTACRIGEENLRGRCVDIDECVRGLHRCGRQQQCVNNDGSYRCTCNSGYEASGSSCYDKDECRTQESRCPQHSLCINTNGSYRCECNRGRTLQNNKCEDIDECSTGQHSCLRGSKCENTNGSYKCKSIEVCPPGQELSADGHCRSKMLDICESIQCGAGFSCDSSSPGRPCRDIDECKESPPKCKSSETCLNFLGTYECRDPCKDVDCGSGLTCRPIGGSYSCVDIDECRLFPRNCSGDNEICVNRYGGYSCRCRDRFQRNSETRKCERKNLCAGVTCPSGYRCIIIDDNNFQCKDINECELSPPKCRKDQRCVNYPGGHYCTCQDGYRLNRRSNRCEDIDECTEKRSGCQQICENTAGSFVCKCNRGFRMERNQRTCSDIDECLQGRSGCSQVCQNTIGSFVCRCKRGFVLSSDGRSCADRNECDSVRCAYRCINYKGGFRCVCPRGYNTTNFYCSDFDECEAGLKCEQDEFCFNTYGSHRCMPKLRCLSDYQQMSATRCDRNCAVGDISCYNNKVMRYSLWTFRLRSNQAPSRIFSYRIVTYRYKTAPMIKYYFHRGNAEGNFEIITQEESNGVFAYIRSKRKIKGPKIIYLEFFGDVTHAESNDLASRFVNQMYVFVSRHEF